MMLKIIFILSSFVILANALVNTKCFQWIYNDGQDCSTYLPSLNLLPVPEVLSHTVKCKEGTYTNAAGTPWECHLFNPSCLDSIKPEFHLFTPEHKSKQVIDFNDLENSVNDIKLDADKPFYVIVHGFGTGGFPTQWMVDMKNALIDLGYNVILVGWTGGSGSIIDGSLYIKAAANTQAVGKGIAIVVNSFVTQKKTKLEKVTVVGFSLGAHIAGYAGNGIKGLKRIIGLDPAGPMFACAHADARLDETDAEFVEVIHTNGDTFNMGGAGTLQRLGTVDFYANGGWIQPGCNRGVPQAVFDILHPSFVFSVLSLNFSMLADDVSCNHGRAPRFFTESIRNAKKAGSCSFTSLPCNNDIVWNEGKCFSCKKGQCPNAGLPLTETDLAAEGKYFFKTHPHNFTGYCGAEYLISLTSNVDVKGQILIELINDKKTNLITFQGESDYLTANTPKNIVVTAEWAMQKITSAKLTYNRYYGGILLGVFSSGYKQWTLTKSSITDSHGYTIKSQKNLKIYDATPITVSYS